MGEQVTFEGCSPSKTSGMLPRAAEQTAGCAARNGPGRKQMTEPECTNGVAYSRLPSSRQRAAGYVRSATTPNPESIRLQVEAIGRYADEHGMHVVRIYRDEGKSGLRIGDRQGLRQLFQDAATGTQFDAVLLLEPNRWGRFIDAHEFIADEFARRNADIEIHYCAAHFADRSPDFSLARGVGGPWPAGIGASCLAGCGPARMRHRQGGCPPAARAVPAVPWRAPSVSRIGTWPGTRDLDDMRRDRPPTPTTRHTHVTRTQ